MANNDPVELTLFFNVEKQKSICVSDENNNVIWISKAQIWEQGTVILVDDKPEITIVIPEWLAYDKGLI